MQKPQNRARTLNLAIGADLPDWEKHLFETILSRLSAYFPVRTIPASEHRFLDPVRDMVWVVTSSWEKAARAVPYFFKGPIFLSPLTAELTTHGEPSVDKLFSLIVFSRLGRTWPKRLRFLVHSPFAERFFSEIERVPQESLRAVSLPVLQSERADVSQKDLNVGFLGAFESDTNFPFLLSVLHYVHRQRPEVKFSFCGRGKLETHLRRSLDSLGLGTASEFASLDLFAPTALLYTPLRNAHFSPLLFAASRGIPTVTTEVMGLENYVEDGRHGLVASPEHVRSAAELVLRVLGDTRLATELGARLRQRLASEFSIDKTVAALAAIFSGRTERAHGDVSAAA